VTSPDEKHWGGTEFSKYRDGVAGVFMYYPLWSLDELLAAQPYFKADMPKDQIIERFREVGGVPRNIFFTNRDETLQAQLRAFRYLSSEDMINIVNGTFDADGDFGPKAPKSALVGYDIFVDREEENPSYLKRNAVLISSFVKEQVFEKYAEDTWKQICDEQASNRPMVFETLARSLVSQRDRILLKAVQIPQGRKSSARLHLGGCGKVALVEDPVEAAKNTANVVFHSTKPNYPLIDFVYMDESGHFHAFQATVSPSHDASIDQIRKLQTQVGGGQNLSIYYIMPEFVFSKFVTRPANPKGDGKDILCNIWKVSIEKPSMRKWERSTNT
jgi:hypothetical protein